MYDFKSGKEVTDFTLLEEEQVLGPKASSLFIDEGDEWRGYYNRKDPDLAPGKRAEISDFAILLGGNYSEEEVPFYYDTNNIWHIWIGEHPHSKRARLGVWYLKNPNLGCQASYVTGRGSVEFICSTTAELYYRSIGIRPVLPYYLIEPVLKNLIEKENAKPFYERWVDEWIEEEDKRNYDKIYKVAYGEYPQTILDIWETLEFEEAYQDGKFKITGKKYTTDAVEPSDWDKPFQAMEHIEYEYNGKKYIRFETGEDSDRFFGRPHDRKFNKLDKNDQKKITEKVKNKYWICIEPIIWLVDPKLRIALSEKVLVAGIQFQNAVDIDLEMYDYVEDFYKIAKLYYGKEFSETDIWRFLNNCFAKDIIPSRLTEELQNEVHSENGFQKKITR